MKQYPSDLIPEQLNINADNEFPYNSVQLKDQSLYTRGQKILPGSFW